MKIVKALLEDSKEISNVCFLSKAYWGYSKEQLEEWRVELTLTEEYIGSKKVFKLVEVDKIIAFYAYYKDENSAALLDYLFVHPSFIGQRLGTILMDDFLLRIRDEGFSKAILHADPNAASFYVRFNFETVGKKKTSIEGRYLAIMQRSI